MNDHYSMLAADSLRCIAAETHQAQTRPSVLYRPSLRKWVWPDARGTYWTASYGDVMGKGERPKDAMTDFDLAWERYTNSNDEKTS